MSDVSDLLQKRIELLEGRLKLQREEKWRFFQPYEPQLEFFALGGTKRERLLMAGNQLGKTVGGAFEMSRHLTGIYPSWWKGKRFTKPIKAWAGGQGAALVRDKIQAELCGPIGSAPDFGTGFIEKRFLLGRTLSHGVTDAFDMVRVQHASGGVSMLMFKSYDQGRDKWQSDTCDVVWEDEEPPDDIHGEALARLTGDGILYVTCTPLKGKTPFIRRFTGPYKDQAEAEGAPYRGISRMGLKHVTHYTEEQKQQRLMGFKATERRARSEGDPVLEQGVIYETPEEDLKITAKGNFLSWVPHDWPRIWGIDFGGASNMGHPFAAALCAIEPRPAVHPWEHDNDVFYVLAVLRMRGTLPVVEANAMKRIAINVPVAWPHDGTHHEKASGEPLMALYRKEGLNMLAEHATHANVGGYQPWPGIREMDGWMRTGRFKVLDTCHEFFEEYGTYHTKDNGDIHKEEDDVLDAVRCAFMMRRRAKAVPFGGKRNPRTGVVKYGDKPFKYF